VEVLLKSLRTRFAIFLPNCCLSPAPLCTKICWSQTSDTARAMDQDWFESVLNLEDDYYDEGFQKGVEDGSQAGRIEGRQFGLEKGFEKYLAMGQLNGKACVWVARLPSKSLTIVPEVSATAIGELDRPLAAAEELPTRETDAKARTQKTISVLPPNMRLKKHITTLYALTEPESLSTQNNEESVSDFDDRYKRAVSKAKVIQNIIGERNSNADVDAETKAGDEVSNGKEPAEGNGTVGSRGKGVKISREKAGEKHIEDFGLKGI
jgi:hypothetical protein